MKHIDPSDINIINYLTGEMNQDEMKQFELQLEENLLLRKQVDEIKNVQGHLGIWNDEHIEVPAFESIKSSQNTHSDNAARRSKKFYLPNWLKYAAIFLGFVCLLQLIGLRVNHNGNTLLLSFGEPNAEHLDAGDVDAIVAKAITKYAEEQNNNLGSFKKEINDDLAKLTTSVNSISHNGEINMKQMESLFSRNMDQQFVSLESMIKSIEDNQRQELEDSFTGLVNYIEKKRVNDQSKIQNAFSEIATAINNQQYQTNALLTSISDEDSGLRSY